MQSAQRTGSKGREGRRKLWNEKRRDKETRTKNIISSNAREKVAKAEKIQYPAAGISHWVIFRGSQKLNHNCSLWRKFMVTREGNSTLVFAAADEVNGTVLASWPLESGKPHVPLCFLRLK